TLKADIIVKTEIDKKQIEIEAAAEAEKIRITAQGEADAIFAKMQAQAKGIQEMLSIQAEGLKKIVDAAGGNPNDAMKLLITDKLEEITKIQVEAVKNLKIDKVTVWDNMSGKDGSSTTSNFMSSMLKAIPPMNEMFDMAGLALPEILGKEKSKSDDIAQ
ncbi:MAG: flotillin family protein, partial [Oscillospiraceae bacterium]